MPKYKVNFKTEIITKSGLIDPEDCASIEFDNIGNDSASLNNDIPLNTGNMPRKFESFPGCTIQDRFIIKFNEASQDRQILVIKTFFTEIP